ncbi:MAG: recombination mediator RecR, partial [Clostridia bacterium]
MARYNIPPLETLVDWFESFQGIGHKSAQRVAYHVLNMSREDAQSFAKAITDAHEKIKYCSVCCNLTDSEICPICKSDTRDKSIICVVEDPRDVFSFEKTNEFNATYHVLHGAISPLGGVGPDQLKIKELLARLGDGVVKEVIMATNPNVEGEATAMYIS